VNWSGDRLTVAAFRASLPAVLAEVSRQTNVRFIGLERVTGTLDIDVKDELLGDALQKLLADVNFLMSRRGPAGQADSLLVIWLHPRTDAASPSPSGSAKPGLSEPVSAPRPATVASQAAVLEKIQTTDLGPWLTAANADDPRVRLQALQKLAAQDQFESLTAQVLENALEDSDSAVRDQAFELLTLYSAEEKVLERIDRLLAHPNAAVRVTAVSALRTRSGDEVTRLLNRALADDNAAVRAAAGELLRDVELLRQTDVKP